MDSFNTQPSPLEGGNKAQYMWVIGGLIVLALIFVGYRMLNKNSGSDTDGEGYNQEEALENMTEATGDLEVENQIPGDIVYISSVTLSKPGFVAISITKGANAGKVIGTKGFPEGNNPGQIVVSEKTMEGQTYTATLYADDGDGKLDATKDRVLVEKTFRATKYLDYIKG
jgi:hypothetical protein